MVVGKRGIRPGADDHVERHGVGAFLAERPLHPPCDLGLGAADQLLAAQALVRGVGDAGGAADRGELGVVLDCAQPRDGARRRDELGSVGREGVVAGDGDVVGLEGDRRQPSRSRSAMTASIPASAFAASA
jgi:hypothetical protein